MMLRSCLSTLLLADVALAAQEDTKDKIQLRLRLSESGSPRGKMLIFIHGGPYKEEYLEKRAAYIKQNEDINFQWIDFRYRGADFNIMQLFGIMKAADERLKEQSRERSDAVLYFHSHAAAMAMVALSNIYEQSEPEKWSQIFDGWSSVVMQSGALFRETQSRIRSALMPLMWAAKTGGKVPPSKIVAIVKRVQGLDNEFARAPGATEKLYDLFRALHTSFPSPKLEEIIAATEKRDEQLEQRTKLAYGVAMANIVKNGQALFVEKPVSIQLARLSRAANQEEPVKARGKVPTNTIIVLAEHDTNGPNKKTFGYYGVKHNDKSGEEFMRKAYPHSKVLCVPGKHSPLVEPDENSVAGKAILLSEMDVAPVTGSHKVVTVFGNPVSPADS